MERVPDVMYHDDVVASGSGWAVATGALLITVTACSRSPLGDGASTDGTDGVRPPDAEATPATEAWLQAGHDAARTGRTLAVIASKPQLLWEYRLVGDAYVAPLVDANGAVYLASYFGDGWEIVAVSPQGSERWRVNSTPVGGMAIVGDSLVLTTDSLGVAQIRALSLA